MRNELGEEAITDCFFFAGKQDIEDSISNDVWINFVKDATEDVVIFNETDIQEIKAEIPENEIIRSNDKFFKRLEKLVKQKLGEVHGEPITWTVLNSKGNDSAQSLLKHIYTIEQVSPSIKNAFDKLSIKKSVETSIEVEAS
jgi:hypothetical protein